MRHALLRATALSIAVLPLLSSCRSSSPGPDPTPVCTTTITPASRAFTHASGTGTITVSTSAASCAWTAVASAPWVAITAGATGTGSGTVQYTVAANETADVRTSAIGVADQLHIVTQAGVPPTACTYVLTPSSATAPAIGRTDTFTVTAPDTCAWTAQPTAPWITIQSGGTGMGNGTVTYRSAENTTTSDRTATIVVGNATFALTQSGAAASACTYSVGPVQFAPCMAAGSVTTRVETQAGCSWTVSVDSPWLTIAGAQAGSGTADIAVQYASNYDAPRNGIVMVRWPTPTAGQNVFVAQAGCVYGVSQATFNIASGGGAGTFDVLQQSIPSSCGGPLQDRCVWSATTTAPWVTISTSMPRTGDNPVSFTVAANPTTTARTATIVVGDKVVQITQAGTP